MSSCWFNACCITPCCNTVFSPCHAGGLGQLGVGLAKLLRWERVFNLTVVFLLIFFCLRELETSLASRVSTLCNAAFFPVVQEEVREEQCHSVWHQKATQQRVPQRWVAQPNTYPAYRTFITQTLLRLLHVPWEPVRQLQNSFSLSARHVTV